jgi:hypothetical protein
VHDVPRLAIYRDHPQLIDASELREVRDHQPIAFCHIRVRIIRKDALRACL